MTRSDINLIVRIYREFARRHNLSFELYDQLVQQTADTLQGSNPRFNPQTFIKACIQPTKCATAATDQPH